MKKITYTLAAIFASAFALTSCTKEMTDSSKDIESQGIPFEICASVSQTRTTTDNSWNTTWVAKDAINLFHAKAGTTTYESDGQFTVADTESGKFKGTLAGTLDADSYDWYAFYPYKSQISSPGQQTDGYTFIGHSGAATQNGNNDRQHLGTTLCPLYGISKGLKASAPVAIEMQQLTSVVEIVVKNTTTEPLTVTSIAFSTDEDIVGSYYINFAGENVVYTPKDGYTKTVANLTVNNGTALNQNETASFFIPIKPHVANSGSTITLTVNGYEKTKELPSDVTFAAGKIKTLNFDFDKNNCVVLPWSIDGTRGSSAWKNTVGLSQSGLGSDYTAHSPYCSRMDDTGDFVQIKYDSPAKAITFAVKMIGGKTTSYMSLQGSDEGNSFTEIEKFTISGPQNNILTFTSANEIKSSYRYLRLVFTKGANIGLGKVAITKNSTDPAIDADNISDVSARGESDGVLKYTIQNPVEETSIFATCDGVVVTQVVEKEGSFLYKVAPNQTTSAREGSITLTYGAVSKIVTVSQLAPVFTVSRTEVELAAEAESSTTITITSDFDWYSDASSAAGFTSTPTTCEWTTEHQYTDGKTTVTIKANAANDSKEGTKELGTLTFTNLITAETLAVTVKQKSSYTPPITSNIKTFNVSDFSGGTSSTGSEVTTTMKPITVATDKGYVDPNTAVRVYKNGYITISSTLGVITKIELTSTASNGSDYGPAKLSLPSGQPGSSSYSSNVTTWKGSASEVKFKATAQYRFTKIVVTYN